MQSIKILRSLYKYSNAITKIAPEFQTLTIGRPQLVGSNFQYSTIRSFSITSAKLQTEEVEIVFVRASGERIKAKGKVGDNLLDVVVNNNIDLDGFGSCEGTLTCSTCHLIFKPNDFEKLPNKPADEELDMLDLAYDLTDTSRLGCQVILSKDMNGWEVQVPATVNDARSA